MLVLEGKFWESEAVQVLCTQLKPYNFSYLVVWPATTVPHTRWGVGGRTVVAGQTTCLVVFSSREEQKSIKVLAIGLQFFPQTTVLYCRLCVWVQWLNCIDAILLSHPHTQPKHMQASTHPHPHTHHTQHTAHTHVPNDAPTHTHSHTVLETKGKWWMDKCPSGDILGQTISALLRHIFVHINNSVTALCVRIKWAIGSAQPNAWPRLFWVGQNAKMVGKCLNADHYF